MYKTYRLLPFFFITILALVTFGFYGTYLKTFPHFTGFQTVHHFHGLMMLSWFAMLIAQPLLIRYHQYELHKQVGKLSYLLVPLILWSIFLVSKASYLSLAATVPPAVAIGGLALNIPDILGFGLFYVLAMVNKRNTPAHIRYIIGTSLLLIGPGFGRACIVYGHVPFPVGIMYAIILTYVVAIALLIYDLVKKHNYKPYLVILVYLLFHHFFWSFQMSPTWQAFGGWFARVFF